jgi:hypothetical protein
MCLKRRDFADRDAIPWGILDSSARALSDSACWRCGENGAAEDSMDRPASRIPLPGLPGSAEFNRAYEGALATVTVTAPIGAKRTKPGSVSAAIVGYYTSLEFRSLAAVTQKRRRAILERFRADPGDKPIALLPQKFIATVLGKMTPHGARNWFKAIRGLMQFAVTQELCPADPTQGLKLPRVKSDGIHTWTDAEIAQYEAHHPIGTTARLALPLYTGQRRGDVIRMGPQHVRDGVPCVNRKPEHPFRSPFIQTYGQSPMSRHAII